GRYSATGSCLRRSIPHPSQCPGLRESAAGHRSADRDDRSCAWRRLRRGRKRITSSCPRVLLLVLQAVRHRSAAATSPVPVTSPPPPPPSPSGGAAPRQSAPPPPGCADTSARPVRATSCAVP